MSQRASTPVVSGQVVDKRRKTIYTRDLAESERPASARLVAILPHDPTDADIEAFVEALRSAE
jgi:hypothetical protein